MASGNDSILDMYLYETNTLLEQLDGIVLAAEQAAHYQGLLRHDGVQLPDDGGPPDRGYVLHHPGEDDGRGPRTAQAGII